MLKYVRCPSQYYHSSIRNISCSQVQTGATLEISLESPQKTVLKTELLYDTAIKYLGVVSKRMYEVKIKNKTSKHIWNMP